MSPRTTKKPKGETHSVRIDKDLDDWVESEIKSKELGSWSHAIQWGLTLLKEKLEKKK
jgi:Arc/MetJ-type ribon-helix-helix transcriptional regulator